LSGRATQLSMCGLKRLAQPITPQGSGQQITHHLAFGFAGLLTGQVQIAIFLIGQTHGQCTHVTPLDSANWPQQALYDIVIQLWGVGNSPWVAA